MRCSACPRRRPARFSAMPASFVLLKGLAAVGAAMVTAAAPGLSGGVLTASAPGQCTTPSQQLYHGVPWTQHRMDPQRVWPLTKGQGVTVAVIDTGVDAMVPQLAGHVLPGVDVVNGVGTANNDCYGHGTFVAGIIASQPAAGTGVTG